MLIACPSDTEAWDKFDQINIDDNQYKAAIICTADKTRKSTSISLSDEGCADPFKILVMS